PARRRETCAASLGGPPACAPGRAPGAARRVQAAAPRRSRPASLRPGVRRDAAAPEAGRSGPGGPRAREALGRPRENARVPPPVRAGHSPQGPTALGQREAAGGWGRAPLGSSPSSPPAVRNATVGRRLSSAGAGWHAAQRGGGGGRLHAQKWV